ncbi:TraR/DksA family transcriptional regulator [Streptomyces sp. GS7]|uniref:TraR/DksA family transcriptional regulator n=1 Tax=Streptomyces sp. GS7 TaxID=2692234 RepID=UPI001315AEF9|nr:TraR/DksA C4-type zinc finger protein [Streptomyces sp. GS7]QHC21654.1 DNA-binding protein [Streptomyces sp. GS7]
MVAKKTAAEKSTTPAEPADEAVAQQPAHKKAAGHPAAPRKAAPKRAAAKRAALAKAAAKKTTAKKTAAGKKAVDHTPGGKAAAVAKKTGAKTVVAKKAADVSAEEHGAESAVPSARTATAPGELAVRPGEDPWTPAEVAEARAGLMEEAGRLRSEIVAAEDAIAGLMRDSGDGAGDDEADTGTKNITREHELALASNAREMLHQTERALGRLDAGTYGLCENCGNPIGKARMQAFPRATLCVECKQKQERR